MTKSFISDLSTTAGSNTDLAVVGVRAVSIVFGQSNVELRAHASSGSAAEAT